MTSNQRQPKLLRISDRLNLLFRARLGVAISEVRKLTGAKKRLVSPCIAKMVLIALGDHHGADGKIYPGITRLADESENSERTVQRAIRTLEAIGVVTVTRRNALRGQSLLERTNWYLLNWDRIRSIGIAEEDDDQEPSETAEAGDQRSSDELVTQSHQVDTSQRPTVTNADDQRSPGQVTKGRRSKRPTVTQTGQNEPDMSTGETQPVSSSGRADNIALDHSAAACQDLVLEALDRAGIGEPVRSELARLPLTPSEVEAEALQCRAVGKGAGVMVENLRALARRKEANVQRGARLARQKEALAASATAQCEAERREQLEEQARFDALAALGDEQLQELKRRALDLAGDFTAERHRKSDPRTHRGLQRLILTHLDVTDDSTRVGKARTCEVI